MVTGASGNVGREVVLALAELGIPVRAADRSRRQEALPPGVDPVELDFFRPETFAPAVAGAGALFLMRPPPISRVGPTLNRLVDVAADSGVRNVVFLSVIGAGSNRMVPHHRVESHLQAGDVPWTILRPSFFAQNLGDAYRAEICERDRIYVPAGEGKVAFIDVRDIANVAARVLAEPKNHAGRAYDLTGSEAVSFREVAATLSQALEREISYWPASIPGYFRRLRSQGLPVPQVVIQTILHADMRRGGGSGVTGTLGSLLERDPRTLADYVRDHVDLWPRA